MYPVENIAALGSRRPINTQTETKQNRVKFYKAAAVRVGGVDD